MEGTIVGWGTTSENNPCDIHQSAPTVMHANSLWGATTDRRVYNYNVSLNLQVPLHPSGDQKH